MDTDIFKKEFSKEPELKKDFGIPQFSKWVEAAEKMLKGGKYKDLNSVTPDGTPYILKIHDGLTVEVIDE